MYIRICIYTYEGWIVSKYTHFLGGVYFELEGTIFRRRRGSIQLEEGVHFSRRVSTCTGGGGAFFSRRGPNFS